MGRLFKFAALFCWVPALAPAALAQNPAEARAEFLAGLALEYRPDGLPDATGARDHYQAAARAGSREALLALARLQAPSGALWRTPEAWRDSLTAAARAGWAEAALDLAEALERRTIVAPDLNPAAFYFQAAAAGQPVAARRLAAFYAAGSWGLPRDEGQAILWLTVAAENHDPEAALDLGRRLYRQKNQAAAALWLERAGSPEAHSLLGEIYLADRRFIEAVNAFTVAAEAGEPEAHLALGRLNLDNDFGRRPNPRAALRHLKVAAGAGLSEGAYRLAHMFLSGLATPKDPITGAYWLHRSAELGRTQARAEYDKLVYNFTVGQKKRLERMIAEGPAAQAAEP
ncbi:MAG: sel1 repeat family protein [Candidatus Adiutrix sp.]|jgi:TPR repeat protein|nr:sel1 repeat family protein [Candidatus Adiutrix sp.]